MSFMGTLLELSMGTLYTLHRGDFAFADQTHRLPVPEAEEAAIQ